MKYTFTLFIAFIASFGLYSQNFTFVSGELIEKNILLEEFENAETKIHNLSAEAVIFEWEMITFDNPEGWDFSICDYTVCYTEGETSGIMSSVDGDSESAFIRANVYATTEGIGTYRFVIWDQANPEDKDTVTFVLNASGSAGLADVDNGPAVNVITSTNYLTINNLTSTPINYTLYNLSGSAIQQGLIGDQGQVILSTSAYDKGIYLLNFRDNTGFLRTEKIVVR